MIITTTDTVAGRTISEYIGIVSAEVLVQPKLSRQAEKWAESRENVFSDLADRGDELDAEAIVAVRVEHVANFTGNNYIIATGTAVIFVT